MPLQCDDCKSYEVAGGVCKKCESTDYECLCAYCFARNSVGYGYPVCVECFREFNLPAEVLEKGKKPFLN